VGIWHETYTVAPGQYENIYVNMPRFGMGSAMPHVPITGSMDGARLRMGQANAQEPDRKL